MKRVAWAGIAGVVVLLATGAWWILMSRPKTAVFSSDIGLTFNYSERIEAQPLSDQERQEKKLLFRGVPKDSRLTAPYLVQAWYEDKFRLAANLTKKEPLELLLENQKNSFPKLYPDYRELSLRRIERNGRKGAEILFTYQNAQGATIKQRLLAVLKDDDVAVYVSAQAKEGDFDLVNRRYFETIFTSVSFR